MKKIMIVDDEKISLMMTEHILSSEYQTICASSGDEAISLYMDEQPDLVLSDLHMPEMDGYDLQLFLQGLFQEKIPFMFMTADTDEETEKKGLANGAMDFIRKPFRADVLLHRVENILETVEQIQGLKKAASTDPMTGLFNKAYSERKIGLECWSSNGALMMIDLDNFKLVNDLYGHDMGDKILIRFAEIIQSAIRSSDLAGRLGGDEFIAYCKNVNDELVVARKSAYINEELIKSAKEYMGEDMTIPLGASIGCVFVPDEGRDYSELYKKADSALYEVKQKGKHGYSIYKKDDIPEQKENKGNSDLEDVVKIFSERNVKPGAFTLPNEQFKIIFQFLTRYVANYKKEVWMLQFTVNSENPDDEDLAYSTEMFIDNLRSSLRQSDIITQTGEKQILVLLLETTKKNIEFVVARVMENWEKTGHSRPDHIITYDKEVLK